MATSQTEVESQAVELSAEAFEAFCDDISGMFGADMACEQQDVTTVTVKDLKKHFKKLTAVNSVKAEGVMDGTFQLVFDQGGLFTLSGVIVMMPANRILEEIKRGTVEDMEAMNDAIGETGNLLVGTWDRVFREGLEGHGHFVQSNSFIGKPWDEPEKTIGLAADGEFVFVSYEMTIGEYPAFKCGVIFPRTIFGSKSDAEQAASAQEEPKEKPATEEAAATEEKAEPAQEEPEEKPATEEATAEQKEADADTDASDNTIEEKPAVTDEKEESKEPAAGVVSETIQKMAESPAVLPGESTDIFLAICAKDIMEKNIIWGNPDDSVQQVLAKMQQADAGYTMVGSDGALEGIVSKSDIAGAISPYLRPIFAKWRRPLDDATLQIKTKWIMTRPVHTVSPDTSLAAIMQNMSQLGQRGLPVVDKQGKVQGLVTVFDIFRFMLNDNPNVSMIGKTSKAPPLI